MTLRKIVERLKRYPIIHHADCPGVVDEEATEALGHLLEGLTPGSEERRAMIILVPQPYIDPTRHDIAECSGACPANDGEFTSCRAGCGKSIPVFLPDYQHEDGSPSFHLLVPGDSDCPWYEGPDEEEE